MSSLAPLSGPPVPRAVQRRRQLRLARIRARTALRTTLLPSPGPRRRQRADLCAAANALTALGIRVEVLPPAAPWPRAGRFLLADSTGWLGDLALVAAALDRTPAAPDDRPVICPVTIRYRTPRGYLRAEEVPARPADVAAIDGLVVEVQCLPARQP